jgi:Tfp pilus assembly protein PilX
MKNILLAKKPGVTSLLVVLVLGLILTVMVAGISTLALREQQQATNTDFSNRALQVAESAVKLTSDYLATNPTYNKAGCTFTDNSTLKDQINSLTQGTQGISCIEISNEYDGNVTGYLENDKTVELVMGPDADFGSGKTPRYISLDWHNDKDPKVAENFYPSDNSLYPSVNEYKYPASIEMTILWWPKSSKINTTTYKMAVNSKTIFVMPGRDDTGASNLQTRCKGQAKDASSIFTSPTDTQLGDYTCGTAYSVVNTVTKKGFDLQAITGIPVADLAVSGTVQGNYNFAFRIKPRYIGTHFSFDAFDEDGQSVQNIKSSKAKIDVTAKYNDVYRRIIAEKSIGFSALENVFDAVLYAGKGESGNQNANICKRLVIIKDSNLEPDSQKNLCSTFTQ